MTEDQIIENIRTFIDEVIFSFDDHPRYNLYEIRISLIHEQDYIFILHDRFVTQASLPIIMDDLLKVCKIRKLNLSKIDRVFIKVALISKES